MNDSDRWGSLERWFPDLEDEVWEKLREFTDLLRKWNQKVNLVSRKDMERFETSTKWIRKWCRTGMRAKLLR